MIVVAPDDGDIVACLGQVDTGQRVHLGIVPTDLGRLTDIADRSRAGGAVQPEAPHEPRIVLPGAPIVTAVVAPVVSVVRIEHDAARPEWSRFELPDQRPARVRNRIPHTLVVCRAAVNDVVDIVLGLGPTYPLALHAADVVVEIEMIRAGEVVVVLLVVEGPVV